MIIENNHGCDLIPVAKISFRRAAREDARPTLIAPVEKKLAGIRCVIVPNQLTRKMRFPEQVNALESLEEFSLKEYLQARAAK